VGRQDKALEVLNEGEGNRGRDCKRETIGFSFEMKSPKTLIESNHEREKYGEDQNSICLSGMWI